jgi:hypothetical protein
MYLSRKYKKQVRVKEVIYSINGKKTSFEARASGFRCRVSELEVSGSRFQEKQLLNTEPENSNWKSAIRNRKSPLVVDHHLAAVV